MKSPTQKLVDVVMVAVTVTLALMFYSITADAQLKACHAGYWAINTVTTNLEEGLPASAIGLQVEQVADDAWVGTVFLNDGWVTLGLDSEGAGVVNDTVFSRFEGRTFERGTAYFLPEIGEAGYGFQIPDPEDGIWGCVFTDKCVRQFTITQLTFPGGQCNE